MIEFLQQLIGWFADPVNWQGSDGVWMRLFEHVWYSLFAVLAAVAIGLPIGLLVGHTNRGGEVAMNIAGLGRAIPSLGVLVLAFALAGFGYRPIWVVLTVLGLPPIVTNSYVGIRSLDPEVRESAQAMGMTGWQVLTKVEIPVAMPLLMAGIRTAAVQIVATTTLAAFIAAGGLGRYIFDGLPQQRDEEVVAGALLVAALALLTEFGLGRLQLAVTPRGLRRDAHDDGKGLRMTRGFRLLGGLLAGALLASCAVSAERSVEGGEAIVVGAGNFTEHLILANIYAGALEEAGLRVDRSKIGVGPREIYFPAMQNGEIDVMPEYLGAMYDFLSLRQEGGASEVAVLTEVAQLRAAVGTLLVEQGTGLELLESSSAQDQDALAVTQETAQRFNLRTVSDLAPVADQLVAGGPPEEETRRTGLSGLRDVYGITFKDFIVTDAGGPVTLEALKTGRIQVARVFTTSGFIEAENLVVLEEDRPLIPGENVTPIVRSAVRTPTLEAALNAVSAALTTQKLTELNKRVDIDQEDPADVAHDFLVREGLVQA